MNRESYESSNPDSEQWQNVCQNLQNILQTETNSNTTTDVKSRFELISSKSTKNEYLLIQRNFENLDEKHSFSKYLIDLKSENIDKNRQQWLNDFCNHTWSKSKDENKHKFTLKWNDDMLDNQDLTETANFHSKTGIFRSNPDFLRYLEDFNKVIVSKTIALIAKSLSNELGSQFKSNEIKVYHEATRHMCRFRELCEENISLYGLDAMTGSLNALIDLGKTCYVIFTQMLSTILHSRMPILLLYAFQRCKKSPLPNVHLRKLNKWQNKHNHKTRSYCPKSNWFFKMLARSPLLRPNKPVFDIRRLVLLNMRTDISDDTKKRHQTTKHRS